MKKILFSFIILGLLVSAVSLVNAEVIVGTGVVGTTSSRSIMDNDISATFTLKVGEKYVVENYLNMEIELEKVKSTSPKNAEINVSTEGGCGPNADPRCLGLPSFEETYTINEGASVNAMALKITLVSVLSGEAKFLVSTPQVIDTYQTPSSCIPRPPCLDATPKCLMAEPALGWCSKGLPTVVCTADVKQCSDGTYVGRTGSRCEFATCGGEIISGSINGTVTSGGVIIVCPNGLTGSNCSTCRDGECSPSDNPVIKWQDGSRRPDDGDEKPTPPILNLPQGQVVISAEKVEADGDADAYFEVKASKKARLFFLFPVNPKITYSVDAETGESTVSGRSWWSFLAW